MHYLSLGNNALYWADLTLLRLMMTARIFKGCIIPCREVGRVAICIPLVQTLLISGILLFYLSCKSQDELSSIIYTQSWWPSLSEWGGKRMSCRLLLCDMIIFHPRSRDKGTVEYMTPNMAIPPPSSHTEGDINVALSSHFDGDWSGLAQAHIY